MDENPLKNSENSENTGNSDENVVKNDDFAQKSVELSEKSTEIEQNAKTFGDFDEKSSVTPQNASVTLPEAPEVSSENAVPSNPTIVSKPQEALQDAPETLSASAKPSKPYDKKWHILLVVVLVGVLLAIIGAILVVSLKSGEMNNTNREPEGLSSGVQDNKEEENDADESWEVDKNDETQSSDGIEVVSLDGVVRQVYDEYANSVNSLWDNKWLFRVNPSVLSGNPDKEAMVMVALSKLEYRTCEWNDSREPIVCLPGQEVRDQIKRLFDREVTFTNDDEFGNSCGTHSYNLEFDEFRHADGCGGAVSMNLYSIPYKAEQDDNNLYIYEKVLFNYFGEGKLYHIGDFNEIQGAYIGTVDISDTEEWELAQEEFLRKQAMEHGDQFKWTFRRTADGNYVFEKIERIN